MKLLETKLIDERDDWSILEQDGEPGEWVLCKRILHRFIEPIPVDTCSLVFYDRKVKDAWPVTKGKGEEFCIIKDNGRASSPNLHDTFYNLITEAIDVKGSKTVWARLEYYE